MKILTFILLATLSACAYAEDSCELMGVTATNYAETAYKLTSEEPDLINQQGIFNTWIIFLSHMLKSSEKKGLHTKELFASSKIAGSTIVENQKDIESKISPTGNAPLFASMVIRSCEAGRASESDSGEVSSN